MRFGTTRRRLLFVAILGLGIVLIVTETYLLSPSVRSVVVAGAERVGADDYLVGRLSDRDLRVRGDASEALVRRGAKAVPALVARLDDPDPGNRRSAASTLARIGPAAVEAIPALLRLAMEDDDEGVLETAGQAVGVVARDHPGTVSDILVMLESPADSSRLAATRAAACLDDPRAVPPLMASLKHANPKVREEAAESLGSLGKLATPALPALIEVLDDPEDEVRSEAREAIAKILKNGSDGLDAELVARAKRSLEKAGVRRITPPPAPDP
jgi:HEAT repeat protein